MICYYFFFTFILNTLYRCSAFYPSTDSWKYVNVIEGYDKFSLNPYIMMGDDVEVGRYPWYSVLYIDTSNGGTVMCGAVLVSPTDLVTAAHCVNEAEYVRGNFHLWKQPDNDWGYKPSFSVDKNNIIVHPQYNPYNFFGDIAIIRLDFAITQIMPIVLSSDKKAWENNEDMVSVIGHGITETNDLSSELRIIDIPVVRYEDCVSYSSSSQNTWLPMHVHDDLCAGFTDGCEDEYCADACHGDSGGPIFDPRSEIVFGIVSRGEYPCGQSQRPAMFASMSAYRSFIDKYSRNRVSWSNNNINGSNNTHDYNNASSSVTRFHIEMALFVLLLFY